MYESRVGRGSACGVRREAVRVTCHLHMLPCHRALVLALCVALKKLSLSTMCYLSCSKRLSASLDWSLPVKRGDVVEGSPRVQSGSSGLVHL